ncbi:MAG: helicase-exonuclease AddAB subunit AddA [Clostridiales bacterium]|nr:helicase-exonuclease AddAB subunit AddA [Clostridiales bacterium]
MPTWTPQQLMAIDASNNTILVSAAAGSGKTAVLVERIVQLIRGGFHLNRMLIVTFTRNAAAEMRQRLYRRLLMEAAEDPETFAAALDELESTEISTIHAFCQKVLRNNFQAVGIDPMVRPCEDQMRKTLFDAAWLDAFNTLLERRDDLDFMDLAYAWDQPRLQEITGQLYDFLMSLPNPFDWLRQAVEKVDQPLRQHPWVQVLLSHAKLELQGIPAILQAMRRMFDEPDAVQARMETLEADESACAPLFHVEQCDLQGLLTLLESFSLPRAKAIRGLNEEEKAWSERLSKQRKKITEMVKGIQQNLTLDEEITARELAMIQRHLRGLLALTRVTHDAFLAKKAENHLMDFSDMEQFTMQVLSDPALRAQMQGEYDHIFVDECQDVSQVQDAILQAIHNDDNCLFMVGDVKQSIYRFRKADPTLFMERLRTYSDEPDAKCRRIILQKNFRSRGGVLNATNIVFRNTMRPQVTELAYEQTDELICGRETQNDPPVEMHLLDVSPGEDGEAVEALEAEAQVVIERIRALLNEQFDDGSGLRNYTYRDMVILLSAASTTAPKLVEILGRAGIPVFYDGAAAFYQLPEVQSMKALLCVIDNPLQDIPLLSALKMPPFSLTDTELGVIRTAKTGKNVPFYEAFDAMCAQEGPLGARCRGIREHLAAWRFQAESMRLSDFLWGVMQSSGYYAAVGALPRGALRQANLRMLYQRAQAFEQEGGETLSDFLRLTDEQAAGDDRMSAKILGENENLLRIMTMHKSKGLEFPVVFLMQMSGSLHKPFRNELLLHTRLGIALPYVNRELRIKRKTLADAAFKVQRELDEKAERARLLYVAMTRAKERLIMVGCCKESQRDVWLLPPSDYAVWQARSMTDWVMQAVSNGIHSLSTTCPQDATPWNIRVWNDFDRIAVDNAVDKVDAMGYIRTVLTTPSETDFPSWTHQEAAVAVPLKTSVSAIAKQESTADALPPEDIEEDETTKRAEWENVSPLRLSELPSRPAFMEEKRLTGAERGTLIHRALSLIPLEQLRHASNMEAAVKQAIHELADREVFTYQEVMLLSIEGVAGFFESELGQRLLKSATVRREWAFNLVMDERGALLQGVIDCAFQEDGAWVLVDYKTDRIQDEDEFVQRYRLQLSWYERALERITGLPVKEKYLYAIGRSRAYKI